MITPNSLFQQKEGAQGEQLVASTLLQHEQYQLLDRGMIFRWGRGIVLTQAEWSFSQQKVAP